MTDYTKITEEIAERWPDYFHRQEGVRPLCLACAERSEHKGLCLVPEILRLKDQNKKLIEALSKSMRDYALLSLANQIPINKF